MAQDARWCYTRRQEHSEGRVIVLKELLSELLHTKARVVDLLRARGLHEKWMLVQDKAALVGSSRALYYASRIAGGLMTGEI